MAFDIEQTIDELKSLSVDERLLIVEAVWDSLPDDASSVPLSQEQQVELDRRLEAHEANSGHVLTCDQVLERLQERL